MRFLVKVNIPVEAGNQAARAGKLGATIQSILADLKPEAVYFTDDSGQRAAFLFLEMNDDAQIPAHWRAVVAGAECEYRDPPCDDTRGSRQGEWRHRGSRQEVRLRAQRNLYGRAEFLPLRCLRSGIHG